MAGYCCRYHRNYDDLAFLPLFGDFLFDFVVSPIIGTNKSFELFPNFMMEGELDCPITLKSFASRSALILCVYAW
jgi:hypothetical protein